jgi:tetratricopeptide (TPR) repeat protein
VISVHGVVFAHYNVEDRAAEAYAMITLWESEYATQAQIARAFGYSARSLRRYQERFEEEGIRALVRKPGRPAGRSSERAPDEALSSDPDNAYVQNLRAYALFRLGRVDTALEGQRRSVAADPSYAWGYFDLARFLCAVSPPRIDEARKAAAKAIELRPDLRGRMQADGEFQKLCQHRIP